MIKIREDPTCSSCSEGEKTALHFTGSCPATVILCKNFLERMPWRHRISVSAGVLVRFATAFKSADNFMVTMALHIRPDEGLSAGWFWGYLPRR